MTTNRDDDINTVSDTLGGGWVPDTEDCEAFDRIVADYRKLKDATRLRPRDEWHEDLGNVLWWKLPIEEPPYCGSPLHDDFPDYVTHWTTLLEPEGPET